MAQSALPAAIAARDPDAMRAAIVGELVPVIPSNVDPQTWDPRELGTSGGNVWQAVIWQERIWYRDDTSVADHDEITVIVLLDGGHYLTNDVRFPGAVKSRAVTTPPDPLDTDPGARPAYGDAWRVPAGASGAWSAHEDDVAMWSARGWRYKSPASGDLHYVEDESAFEYFSAAAVWEDGIPFGVTASSIPQSALIWDGSVQNQTTNAPPSAAQGVAYIIGSSPTGAWAGNAGKLAIRESVGTNSTYVIYTPKAGRSVFDISLGIPVRWDGSAWVSASGAWVGQKAVFTAPSTVGATSGSGFYGGYKNNFTPGGEAKRTDGVTLSYTAKRAGADLRFMVQATCDLTVPGTGHTVLAVALYRDSETAAIDYTSLYCKDSGEIQISAIFRVTALDALSHTYKWAVLAWDNANGANSFSRRTFEVMEGA